MRVPGVYDRYHVDSRCEDSAELHPRLLRYLAPDRQLGHQPHSLRAPQQELQSCVYAHGTAVSWTQPTEQVEQVISETSTQLRCSAEHARQSPGDWNFSSE